MFFSRLCLLLFISISPIKENLWVLDQVNEDVSNFTVDKVHTSDLKQYFDQMDANNRQALYCKIRNNTIEWGKTKAQDGWRNPRIFNYFACLIKNNVLPDVDFILLTEDGCTEFMDMPVFAFAVDTAKAKNYCPFPDFEMLWEVMDPKMDFIPKCKKLSNECAWHAKKTKAFFRGVSTGSFNPDEEDFGNDRMRVVLFSYQYPELLDATFNKVFQQPIKHLMGFMNKKIEGASIEGHFPYKYLLDVDGNSCTYSRCRWIILSNSVLVKVMSSHVQWYYKAMVPWEHYVPVKQDLSDLLPTLDYLRNNDEKARQIANSGTELGKKIFSKDVVDLYVLTLLKKYAKITIIDN
jgi:hypothetical protein